MNRQEAKEQMEKLQEEMDRLKEIIEKPESVVWKPKNGESYYYYHYNGVSSSLWSDITIADSGMYEIGNCYQTKEQAENARDAQIILTRLQRLADEANGGRLKGRDWEGINRYSPYYNYMDDCFKTTTDPFNVPAVALGTPFKTKKSAQQALDTLIVEYGEDKIRMALSGSWR